MLKALQLVLVVGFFLTFTVRIKAADEESEKSQPSSLRFFNTDIFGKSAAEPVLLLKAPIAGQLDPETVLVDIAEGKYFAATVRYPKEISFAEARRSLNTAYAKHEIKDFANDPAMGLWRNEQDKFSTLDPADIVSVDEILDEYRAAAYRNELWAAAFIINAGCSDDRFEYFRAWLIAQGRDVFDRALADPNTLADAIVMSPDWDAELEEFLYCPRMAYERATGEQMSVRPWIATELAGDDWDESEVDGLFPALAAKAAARRRES